MNIFKYDKMTPALSAYLNATLNFENASEAWHVEEQTLKAALTPTELQDYYDAKKVWYCRDETQQDSTEHLSPSGKYRLVVTGHSMKDGCWSYSKGRVYEVATDRLIETVCRNYCNFPHSWIENHGQTHRDYLVCGQDYQGQAVVDLTDGRKVEYTPESAKDGYGFCWASHTPNPSGTLLAVSGCYWACPYEVIIVDFSDPMNPPYLILARDDDEHFVGWVDDETCKIGYCRDYVNLPGHPLHGKMEYDCTREEIRAIGQEALKRGAEDEGWEEKVVSHVWRRPPDIEILTQWLQEHIPHWMKNCPEEGVPDDFDAQIALLASRCGGAQAILAALSDETGALFTWAAKSAYKSLSARSDPVPEAWLHALEHENRLPSSPNGEVSGETSPGCLGLRA